MLKSFSLILMLVSAVMAMAAKDNLTFEVSSRAELDLSNVSGNIVVVRGSSDQVVIDYEIGDDRLEVLSEQDGDRVKVWVEYPHHSNIRKGVSFRVSFPAEGDLKVSSVSGNITASEISGDLRINSVSGGLKLSDLSGDIDANSVSGSVKLANIGQASVKANAVSGNIEFSGVLNSGDHSFNSTSGNVTLKLESGASFRLKANSVSGSISSSLEGIVVTKDKYGPMSRAKGSVAGGEADLTVSTISGSIRIN